MAFTNLNTTMEIRKYGVGSALGSDFTTEITNFKEDATIRKINYTKVIGGLVLPRIDTALSKTVEFDFVVEDFKIIGMLNETSSDRISDMDIADNDERFKISLKFTDGSSYYNLFYYNAYVEELSHNIQNDVLFGKIKFSFPMKNINGDSNYYISQEDPDLAVGSIDSIMLWNT